MYKAFNSAKVWSQLVYSLDLNWKARMTLRVQQGSMQNFEYIGQVGHMLSL